MAFTEFYVQPTGSNLNAGSTTSNTAAFTYAAGTFVQSTRVFTVGSGNPQSDGVTVGMFVAVYTTSGATQPGVVGRVDQVTTTTIRFAATDIAGAVANVSEAAGAATLKVGGAWAGPSGTVGFPFNFIVGTLINAAGDPTKCYIKGGTTYEITAGITHSLNGVIFEGYTTTPGDGGMWKLGGDSASPTAPYTMFTLSGAGNKVFRMWCNDNGGTTGGQAVGNNAMFDITGNGNLVQFCWFSDSYRVGCRNGGAGSLVMDCHAHSCNRDDASGFGAFHSTATGDMTRCISSGNLAGTDSCGFSASANDDRVIAYDRCISIGNAGNGFEFTGSDHTIKMSRCISLNNAENGIEFNASTVTTSCLVIEDSVIYGSGLFGIRNASAIRTGPIVRNCAFGDNDSGDTSNVPASFIIDKISLGAQPFEDAVNGDLRPNTAPTGGELLKAAGFGSFFINAAWLTDGASTEGFPDVGAVQTEGGGGAGCGLTTIDGVPIASINEVA